MPSVGGFASVNEIVFVVVTAVIDETTHEDGAAGCRLRFILSRDHRAPNGPSRIKQADRDVSVAAPSER